MMKIEQKSMKGLSNVRVDDQSWIGELLLKISRGSLKIYVLRRSRACMGPRMQELMLWKLKRQ